MAGNARDLALFNLVVDSKLRGCDLVGIRIADIFAVWHAKVRGSMVQNKAGKPVRFEISETTRLSLDRWISDPEMIGLKFLWPSGLHGSPYPSSRLYAGIIHDCVTPLDLEPSAYGIHSMRLTNVAQTYKTTRNLRAVQLLLGRTKMDSMVRYLGVDIKNALTLSKGIDL